MTYVHEPVLLQEAIEMLKVREGGVYVDATLGGGGYTTEILRQLGDTGRLISIDQDTDAINNYRLTHPTQANHLVEHCNFSEIDKIVAKQYLQGIDGIVADLGLSSNHLENSGRGFSFQGSEVLDMRMNPTQAGVTAQYIVNYYDEQRLIEIFTAYGEEQLSGKVARAIVQSRTEKYITTTDELTRLILQTIPWTKRGSPYDVVRRVFQALRIEVNSELEVLSVFLEKAFELLSPKGRLVIITFHSLEDTLVKSFFKKISHGCICPKEFPYCVCGETPQATLLSRKAIKPSETEVARNSRSKSALLRALEKN